MIDPRQAEVEALHRFFEDWFSGRLPDEPAAFARVEGALAADFSMVTPRGQALARSGLMQGLAAMHGSESEFAIRVTDVVSRPVADGEWLVTYQEWHERPDGRRGRLSSAWLSEDAQAPGGLRWRHVHETWLQEEPTGSGSR